MNNRSAAKFVVAFVALSGLFANVARADVGWITQPSLSPVTFKGVMGTVVYNGTTGDVVEVNGAPAWLQQYTAVKQTDAGTSYNGSNNSMITTTSGTFITNGNNFLSSLNFGSRPTAASASPPDYNPTTGFGISGNWLPNGPNATGGDGPGDYGTATPSQAAFTLVGSAGSNYNNTGPLSPTPGGGPLDPGAGPNGLGTAGRVSLTGTNGIINSNNSIIPVTNGTFDSHNIHVTGLLAVSINYQGDDGSNLVFALTGPLFYTLNGGLGDISNELSGAASTSTISRGAGANSYQYIMQAPYEASLSLATGNNDYGANGIGTATNFDFRFGTTFYAIANLRPGDVNFDGVVNAADVGIVGSHWLQTDAKKLGAGDASGDGVVNAVDIGMIGSHWLQTTPPLPGAGSGSGSAAAVPEPGTWVLLGLGSLGMLVIRRRVQK